ncbi:MAG: restriction endonuclease subunit S [Candidatus Methanoperedens sp.]|nr:restriction endonuclease subunit S [Candidatus Methanoperedens sp.]
MVKFLDLFDPIKKGDFGLTEEAIYKSIQHGGVFIPVWGGNQDHIVADRFVSKNGRTKHNQPITIFKGEGIIISLDGSAGSMTFKKNERFALNHHAGFFKVKKGAKNMIIPEFFALFYQKQLQEASISEGSKTLTLDQIYSMDFEIPPYTVQQRIMSKIKPLLEKKKKLAGINSKIESLFAKKIVQ